MKKLALALSLVLPALALAQDWSNVSLLDTNCKGMAKDADGHTTQCLLKCAGSGYGVVGADGKWTALDKKGSELAVAALKSTKKTDHIRVNVTGDLKGDTIAVSKLALAE
jgi:hypothetical protein